MMRYGCLSIAVAFFLTTAEAFAAAPAVTNSITVTSASGGAISNYPFQFGRPFIDGAIANQPQVLINGQPVTTQADVKNRYPDGSVAFAVIAVVIPAIPASGSLTLTFQNQSAGNNTPLTQAQMLQMQYMFDAEMILKNPTGVTRMADARTMLANGDYKLWTAGPVAQTIMLGDDTTARKYDIGFGDGYHPFRPRFYATFWPATHQVWVRCVGENGLTTELEDLAYHLTLAAGTSLVYTADLSGDQPTAALNKIHWTETSWTRSFWLGGTPSPQVNINHNLAYLESTRFIPNFDTSQVQTPAAIAAEYANWTGKPNDLYDGDCDAKGQWACGMGEAGAHDYIAPYPQWAAMWLYTGDWRMRQMSLGMADLAAAYPANLRESDPTRRLSRGDPTGLNPSTGLGHVASATDRHTLETDGGLVVFYGAPTDNAIRVGPITWPGGAAIPWIFDVDHTPSPFYPVYILTGDPWYLGEMYNWASFAAWTINYSVDQVYGRGPVGNYGALPADVRGEAWTGRNRAEAAFAAPDGAPEKAFLTYLTNDMLARWEGGLGITGTPYDGTPIKVWGVKYGNPNTNNGGPDSTQVPPLHNWESSCNPTAACSPITGNEGCLLYQPGVVGTYSAPWNQWYLHYALGRIAELGFAAGPLALWSGQYPIGMINSSGLPILVSQYEMPVEKAGGGFLANWPAVIGTMTATWLANTPPFASQCGYPAGGLPEYFAVDDDADGRQVWLTPGLAMLVDQGAPGAATAWGWWQTNVYAPTPNFTSDPKWAIVPRTDTNFLPPQPTVMPP
jgi:hypothetical protein